MQHHCVRGQKNLHFNKHGKRRKNVGNGLVKLALSTSGAKLAQSSTRQFSYIYQPQNTDACPEISAKERQSCT